MISTLVCIRIYHFLYLSLSCFVFFHFCFLPTSREAEINRKYNIVKLRYNHKLKLFELKVTCKELKDSLE